MAVDHDRVAHPLLVNKVHIYLLIEDFRLIGRTSSQHLANGIDDLTASAERRARQFSCKVNQRDEDVIVQRADLRYLVQPLTKVRAVSPGRRAKNQIRSFQRQNTRRLRKTNVIADHDAHSAVFRLKYRKFFPPIQIELFISWPAPLSQENPAIFY